MPFKILISIVKSFAICNYILSDRRCGYKNNCLRKLVILHFKVFHLVNKINFSKMIYYFTFFIKISNIEENYLQMDGQ